MGDDDAANQVMAERFGWAIVALLGGLPLLGLFAEHPQLAEQVLSVWAFAR